MEIRLAVWSAEKRVEIQWSQSLAENTCENKEIVFTNLKSANIIFVDSKIPGIDEKLVQLDRVNRFIVMVVLETDGAKLPHQFNEGLVDDVIVYPFRRIEILGKLHQFHQLSLWSEVESANKGIENVMDRLKENLNLAERLQTASQPTRFDDLLGVKIESRYLAGLKAGGDYFDVIPSENGMDLSLFLSDSSSYGLSSAVLAVLMKVAIRVSSDTGASCVSTIRKIYSELMATLRERDNMSFFYGQLGKKDWVLKYTTAGTTRAWIGPKGDVFRLLEYRQQALSRSSGVAGLEECRVQLSPDDRLIILSDGFIEAAGGVDLTSKILNDLRGKKPKEILNEFTFNIKRHLKDEDSLPPQDASALILDVPGNILRLMN